MPRLRLGVALLLPPPVAAEVDGLRRATGDGALGRLPAHLTLVPPVNVRQDRMGEALSVLRAAAVETRPISVRLGPPATFLPDNPVLYLPVVQGAAAVADLRERVLRPPLARPLTWPFVAHVTVADDMEPGRIAAAIAALAHYEAEFTFDRVHLLQEGPGRVWAPIADAAFARAAVIGRGGLPLELAVTTQADPEARALAGEGVVVTARRDGRVVGVARGWARHGEFVLADLVVDPGFADEGVARHLEAAFESWAAGSARDSPPHEG